MSKGLASLIAVLGAGMGGYAQGQQIHRNNQRQEKLDQREDERYEEEQAQRAAAKQLKGDLAAAQADQVVENVPSYDVSNMTGGDPTKQPTVGYKASGEVYADKGAASMALHGVNSRSAKDARAAAVLRASGDPQHMAMARQLEEFSQRAIEEGSDKIIGAISASAPDVASVKKAGGMVAGTVGAEAADIFNKTGSRWRVSADTVVQHYLDKDSTGREFVNSRVLGKDGKPVIEDLKTANLMLADYKTRLAQQQSEAQQYQRSVEHADSVKDRAASRAEQARHNRASEGIQLRQEARLDRQFKSQSPEGQIETIERITDVKLTADEKKQFLGLGKGKGTGKTEAELTAKIVEKAVDNFQVNNPDATAGQIAQFASDMQVKLSAAKNNTTIENNVRQAFGNLPNTSPEYAEVYSDAQAQLKLTPEALGQMGYPAPKKAGGTAAAPSRAAAGIAPARPSYREQQAAEAETELQARIATLQRNVASLSEKEATLTPYARRSLAEQRAELARLSGN